MTSTTHFPTLSSFLIFSSLPNLQAHPPHHSQQNGTSDPHPLPPSVLYFFHLKKSSLTPERRDRLIGLARGILNFTYVLSHDLQPHPSTHTGLRVIHSANQKMIFIHPEPGFHLCAFIELVNKSTQNAQVSSKLQNTLNLLPQTKLPQSSYQPSETVLLNSLFMAAQEYRLLNGSFTTIYKKDRKMLVNRLEKFWSVWLWKWNVGKTGCGATDFDEFFGYLESPFLIAPTLPKHPLDLFNRFINHLCPTFPILPILIHNRSVLHLPLPTELINREEIQTLARYLLSLLGVTEARPIVMQRHSSNSMLNVDQDANNKVKSMPKLSGFSLDTIFNLPPKLRSISQPFDYKNSWAHKALSWASTSLVVPVNSLGDDPSDTDTLDQQLRVRLGLSSNTSPKVLSIKSVPPTSQLTTDSILTCQASGLHEFRRVHTDRIADPILHQISCHHTDQVGYPKNLLLIYPPKKSKSRSLYYPDNLKGLYDNDLCQEDQSDKCDSFYQPTGSLSSRVRRIAEPSMRTMLEKETLVSKPSPPSSSIHSKHNPRSFDFNVEHALADAMSEHSIGNISNLESAQNKFDQFLLTPTDHSSSSKRTGGYNSKSEGSAIDHRKRGASTTSLNSLPTSTLADHLTTNRINVHVNLGKLETEVIWIQYENWSLALLVERSDGDDHHPQQKTAGKDEQLDFLVEHGRSVLKSFVESGCSPSNGSLRESSTTSSRLPNLKNPLLELSNQRYLIRNVRTGVFFKQSSDKSSWLLKNQIWPGKVVPKSEVEVSHALLSFFSNKIGASISVEHRHFNPAQFAQDQSSGQETERARNDDGTVEEGFLRSYSGQWVIFKKSCHHSRSGQKQRVEEDVDSDRREFEIFLVLPCGSGTLIEADNELKILERQCEEIEFSIG